MRCSEARDRIDRATGKPQARAEDVSLNEHLAACDDCREYARVADSFETALAAASVDDPAGRVDLFEQRRLVEARLRANRRTRPVTRPHLLTRPAWRAATTVAVVAMVTAFFIPFTRYQTVGYDVNVDGTCMEIGLNHERMCDLLGHLGLVDAGVELNGCDTTCSVSIFDLKTEHEARMVVGAIARICESKLITNIVPIRTKSTRNLLQRANDLLLHGST